MNAKGVYYGLVEAQNLHLKGDDEKELEEDSTASMNGWSDLVDCLAL